MGDSLIIVVSCIMSLCPSLVAYTTERRGFGTQHSHCALKLKTFAVFSWFFALQRMSSHHSIFSAKSEPRALIKQYLISFKNCQNDSKRIGRVYLIRSLWMKHSQSAPFSNVFCSFPSLSCLFVLYLDIVINYIFFLFQLPFSEI